MPDTFLIAGATQGIGLATAQMLQAEGHTVVGMARNPSQAFKGSFIAADLADRHVTASALER